MELEISMRFMPCRLGKDGDLVKVVKYIQDISGSLLMLIILAMIIRIIFE
jgi:hypothetical protein